MLPTEVVRRGAEYLRRHGVESPEANAEQLMQSVLGTDRAGVIARRESLDAAEAKAYGRALCRRCTGTPLQHITGEQGFRHVVLRVGPGVFVPRPETETVVEAALSEVAGIVAPLVIDLCTGAGTIALALAHEHPGARVVAIDLAPEAVALAKANARRLGLGVEVLEGDLFDPVVPELRGTVDLVTANPPYVPRSEATELPSEVLADPELALFSGPEIYGRILEGAIAWLRPGGAVVLEIGGTLGPEVSARAWDLGFERVSVRPDLAGRDRALMARRP